MKNTSPGTKFDQRKLRYSLIPLNVLKEVCKVLEFGAEKYKIGNWKKVKPVKRYYDALLRHIYSWFEGEKKDPESGLNHLAHAMCCIIFLLYNDLKNKRGKK